MHHPVSRRWTGQSPRALDLVKLSWTMPATYGHRPAWSRSGWRGSQDGLGRQPEIPDHRVRFALAAAGGLVTAEPQQAVAHSAHAVE